MNFFVIKKKTFFVVEDTKTQIITRSTLINLPTFCFITYEHAGIRTDIHVRCIYENARISFLFLY